MIKKFILSLFLFSIPIITFASDNSSFGIGNKFYDTLEEAIDNASSEDTIELFSDANFNDTYQINKVVNIDLNGNNISAPSTVFLVEGGSLNISGKGTIKETKPNNGVIRVIGGSDTKNERFSTLNIEKDVTLEGWAGIFITHKNNTSHGVYIDFDGTINAVTDINGGYGAGIYINGNVKHEESHPVINILDNAKITSTGTGLFIAGYATFNINKAYIEGRDSGIGIKAGVLNIDGATIICNGEDETPSEGYNNGIYASGATIQIESNNGYAGNIELNILSGKLTSKNSSVIYEYIGKGNNTLVKNINISGGTFISEVKKDIFLLSNSFKDTHKSFISGGKYSSNPQNYLKSGYNSELEDNLYTVSKSAMAVFKDRGEYKGNILNIMIVILITLFTSIILFIYRLKLFNLFKKIIQK